MKLFGIRVGHRDSAFSVEVENGATVATLKEAIKARMEFAHLSANPLDLFLAKRGDDWVANNSEEMKALYDGDTSKVRALIKTPLKSTCILDDLFKDPPHATVHFLVVDSEHLTCHPIRGKRWRELNERLDRVKKPRINFDNDTVVTRSSHVEWSDVEDVLDYTAYVQKHKDVPGERVKHLYDQLMLSFKMMGGCMMDSNERMREVKRYHFITLVLIHICDLFRDDVKILVNETVKSNTIHGSGFFDFVVQHGDKKICIVVAKKEKYLQGATEALIGCEAVAEREGLETVYAVVTDFVQWHCYRSGETKIEQDDIALGIKSGVPKFDFFVGVHQKTEKVLLRCASELVCVGQWT